MIISIDRNSGLFSPEVSDRTNYKSQQLYEGIQALDVPQKAFHEKVSPFKISTTYDMEQQCYSIGRTHIVSFTLRSNITASNNSFIKVGEVPFFAVAQVMWQTEKGIYKIDQNQLYVYPFSDGTKDDHVMMWAIA